MQPKNRIANRQGWSANLLGLLITASLVLSSFAATPLPPTAQEPVPSPSAAPTASVKPERVDFRQIIVKLKPVEGVQASGAGLPGALQGLDAQPMFADAYRLAGGKALSAQSQSAAVLSGYYQVRLGQEVPFAEASALLGRLAADPAVQTAYMEPLYLPASALFETADFSGQQGYLKDQAQNGIEAEYAWTITGGRGANIQLADVEAGWQLGHEDLDISNSSLIESINSSDMDWINHGTAVLGVIAALHNNKGVNGIAPDTYLRLVSTVSFTRAEAIVKAAANLLPGDILVVPFQALGPVTNTTPPEGCDAKTFESIPIEYWQANYDAIKAATDAGIIVVEAAGTGAVNLDASLYQNAFNRSNRDSGAILVGAGGSGIGDTPAREPVCDANYGKRVDLQGWGDSVTTTGYGDLYSGDAEPDPNLFYTSTFGGSSAASAIVAGAASSLQGVAKARNYLLTPDQMRSILVSTGTAQAGDSGDPAFRKIGPLPNLRAAINNKLTKNVLLLSPADQSDVWTLRPTFTWQPYLGATQYELQISPTSTFATLTKDQLLTGTEYTLSEALATPPAGGKPYYWRVRPMVDGVWYEWPTSSYFQFIVRGATSPVVVQSSPSSGAITASNTPAFTWKKPATLPDGFQIQISTNYDFSGAPDVFVADGATLSYQPAPALNWNTRYYWRVRSYRGNEPTRYFGAWSSRWILYTSIDISAIGSPAVSENSDTLRPTFDWEDVPDAISYQIQVASGSGFGTRLVDAVVTGKSGEPPDSQFIPTSDLPRLKTLFWRVRVRGFYGWSAWTNGETFDSANPPRGVSLKSPSSRAVIGSWQTGFFLSWYRPSDGPAATQGYAIQVSDTRDFNAPVVDTTVPGEGTAVERYEAGVDVALAPETIYYWRVRAIGDEGTGNWSAVWIFYTTPQVPGGLSVDSIDSLRPTLSWEKIELARSYQVQVARDSDAVADKSLLFTSTRILANVTTQNSPPFVLTASLPRRATLVWRVRAGGRYGWSAWSVPESLETGNPPATPVVASPASGSLLNNFSPALDWYASVKIKGNPESDATGYELQISSSASNFSDTADFFYENIDLTATIFNVPADLLPKAGTYYWRVRAKNDMPEFSLWAGIQSFTTPARVSGLITDALSGEEALPLANVTVEISGKAIQTLTDENGEFELRGLPPGDYTLNFAAMGYGRRSLSFSVGYGTNLTRNVALVPWPDDGLLRIVVYWNGSPTDLDAHLWLPTISAVPPELPKHIYKDNVGALDDDAYRAQLDLSNANGFGPEVITVDFANMYTGKYQYAVYTNGSADSLVRSGARVYVYLGSTLKKAYLVPDTGVGRWWKVFQIEKLDLPDPLIDNVIISTQNTITDLQPRP